MRLGIGSWSFPWAIGFGGYTRPKKPLDAFGLLDKAKALGVEIVQICDNLPLHEMGKNQLEQLGKTADMLGISVQTGTRGIEPGHLLKYLEISRLLNASILRTITDVGESRPDQEQVVHWIGQVLPEFAAAGIHIVIENHDRFKVKELENIVKEINSPYVGICLDTVNSFGALECPRQVIEVLAPYTLNLHIKDFTIERIDNKMGFVISGCPAGYGKLDIDFLFKQISKSGRDPDVILELWTPYEETVEKTIAKEAEWARRSIEALKGKVKK